LASPSSSGLAAWHRPFLFAVAAVPACMTIAVLFNHWYGSPVSSGYGDTGELYRWEYFARNVRNYPRWLVESQTPLILLALAAPFIIGDPVQRRRALMLLAFIASVFACYLLYIPFDAWWYLRFLLPAYPALLVLTMMVVGARLPHLPAGTRSLAAVILVAAAVSHQVQYARAGAAFAVAGEWKYEVAGRYVAQHLPQNAVVLAMQHSGSARYYSGRVTLHYQWIPADRLDALLAALRQRGREPYLLLEDWEEPDFRARFAAQQGVRALERAPMAELAPGVVRIYATDEQAAAN
jgi:hypothetical protein